MKNTINTMKTTQVPAHKLAYGDVYISNKESGLLAEVRIVDFIENSFQPTNSTTTVHFIDGTIMEARSSYNCDVMGQVQQFTYAG